MNNTFAPVFFVQKSQYNSALPYTSKNASSSKAVAQPKKAFFVSHSSSLETDILFAYRVVEGTSYFIGISATQGCRLDSLSKAFLESSGLSFNKYAKTPSFFDAFSAFFSAHVGFLAFFFSSAALIGPLPRSIYFFASYFNFFAITSLQNKRGRTQSDRLLYAIRGSVFHQTGTFFTGNSKIPYTMFSVFLAHSTRPSGSKAGRSFSSIKLRSSNFARRFLLRNARSNRPQTFSAQTIYATKVSSHMQKCSKRVFQRKISGIAGFPFFSRRYFQVNSPNEKSTKSRKKEKRGITLTRKAFLVKKAMPQTVYFQLHPANSQEGYLNTKSFHQLKYLLSAVTNSRFSLYQLNALSLARFAFDQERHVEAKTKNPGAFKKESRFSKVKLSQRFLFSLDRERSSRFRYVGVFIKDLIRVSFFARYLKKVNYLAFFYAFALSKLPRNRKETKFLRFLIKLVKVFASQRKERVGVRLRFQGRVNR